MKIIWYIWFFISTFCACLSEKQELLQDAGTNSFIDTSSVPMQEPVYHRYKRESPSESPKAADSKVTPQADSLISESRNEHYYADVEDRDGGHGGGYGHGGGGHKGGGHKGGGHKGGGYKPSPPKCHPQTVTKFKIIHKDRKANVFNQVEVRNPMPHVKKVTETRHTTIRYPVFITQVIKPLLTQVETKVKPVFFTKTIKRYTTVFFTVTGIGQVTVTTVKYEKEYITRCMKKGYHRRDFTAEEGPEVRHQDVAVGLPISPGRPPPDPLFSVRPLIGAGYNNDGIRNPPGIPYNIPERRGPYQQYPSSYRNRPANPRKPIRPPRNPLHKYYNPSRRSSPSLPRSPNSRPPYSRSSISRSDQRLPFRIGDVDDLYRNTYFRSGRTLVVADEDLSPSQLAVAMPTIGEHPPLQHIPLAIII